MYCISKRDEFRNRKEDTPNDFLVFIVKDKIDRQLGTLRYYNVLFLYAYHATNHRNMKLFQVIAMQ